MSLSLNTMVYQNVVSLVFHRCTHKLHTLPRWISSSKVEIVRKLLEDDPVHRFDTKCMLTKLSIMLLTHAQAMLLRETLGVAADSSNKAFRSADIDSMLEREPKKISAMRGAARLHTQTKFVFIAIDPSGGGASAFSIAAVHYTVNNEFAVSVAPHGGPL